MDGRDNSGVAKGAAGSEELTKAQILLDGLRRLKTHSPVHLLPRLVMSQHLAAMLNQSRQRVDDSHRDQRHQLRVVGMADDDDSDDDAGDISLAGDTTITNHHHGGAGGGALRTLATAAILAAAGGLAWQAWEKGQEPRVESQEPFSAGPTARVDQPAPAGPAAVSDWRLGVRVTRHGQ